MGTPRFSPLTGRAVFALMALASLTASAPPESRPVIAVLPATAMAKSVDPKFLGALTRIVSTELLESGYFRIKPPVEVSSAIEKRLRSSYSERYSDEDRRAIGRFLAASQLFTIEVIQIDDECQVSVTSFDVERDVAVDSRQAQSTCDQTALARSARKALGKMGFGSAPMARVRLSVGGGGAVRGLRSDLRLTDLASGTSVENSNSRLSGAAYLAAGFEFDLARWLIALMVTAEHPEDRWTLGVRLLFGRRIELSDHFDWLIRVGTGVEFPTDPSFSRVYPTFVAEFEAPPRPVLIAELASFGFNRKDYSVRIVPGQVLWSPAAFNTPTLTEVRAFDGSTLPVNGLEPSSGVDAWAVQFFVEATYDLN